MNRATRLILPVTLLFCSVAFARKPINPRADGGPMFPPEGIAGGASQTPGVSPPPALEAADAGSLKKQLSDVDEKRKDLEAVTRELEAERLKLEAKMNEAEQRSSNSYLVVSFSVLALLGAGAWLWFRRRRG